MAKWKERRSVWLVNKAGRNTLEGHRTPSWIWRFRYFILITKFGNWATGLFALIVCCFNLERQPLEIDAFQMKWSCVLSIWFMSHNQHFLHFLQIFHQIYGKCFYLVNIHSPGKYAFIEASSPRRNGDKAILYIYGTGGSRCLTFVYHMWGETIGSLAVYQQELGRGLLPLKLWFRNSRQSDRWRQAQVDIKGYPHYKVK